MLLLIYIFQKYETMDFLKCHVEEITFIISECNYWLTTQEYVCIYYASYKKIAIVIWELSGF